MQVSELETLFVGLRGDVDALFMQTPTVDQEGLCRQCEEMHRHLEEQARITFLMLVYPAPASYYLQLVCGGTMLSAAHMRKIFSCSPTAATRATLQMHLALCRDSSSAGPPFPP